VGKVSKATYKLFGKMTELFVCNLFKSMSDLAVNYESNPKTLKASHLKYCVQNSPDLSFLAPTVQSAPDFTPSEKVVRKPARKRPRAARKEGAPKRKAPKSSAKSEEGQSASGQKTQEAAIVPAVDPAPKSEPLLEDDDYDDL